MGVTRAKLAAFILAILGGALIVTGVALVFLPAGLITAGVLVLAGLFGPNVE